MLTAMLIAVSLVLFSNLLHQFWILKLRDFIIHPLLQKVRAEARRGEVAALSHQATKQSREKGHEHQTTGFMYQQGRTSSKSGRLPGSWGVLSTAWDRENADT